MGLAYMMDKNIFEFVIYIIHAGPNGSGKTTITKMAKLDE